MVAIMPLAESEWADARWMVLAPHPDDETLGAGALIATTAADGRLAGVVFLTDGAGSHPHPDVASRERLVRIRREEARSALAVLCGGQAPEIMFLDWPDAGPHADGNLAALADAATLADLCLDRGVNALAVTAIHEPHCDHAAAARLARAAVGWTGPSVQLFEYRVWAHVPPPGAKRAFETDGVDPDLRTLALDAHRSQLTDLLGPGFRLDPSRRQMPDRDVLYLWEGLDAS